MTGVVGRDRSSTKAMPLRAAARSRRWPFSGRRLARSTAIRQIISVNGYVNTISGFADSPKVINGASDLLVEVFGESGRHVRAALGVTALPRNAMVELQMTVEI